ITASSDERHLILHIIEAVASQVFIPLTVGGGVRVVEDVRRLLNAGADKVSINTSAVTNPQLVMDASRKYGSQCIVVAIDANGMGCDGIAWARQMYGYREGEIVLTRIGRDGSKSVFDLEQTCAVYDAVNIDVIA